VIGADGEAIIEVDGVEYFKPTGSTTWQSVPLLKLTGGQGLAQRLVTYSPSGILIQLGAGPQSLLAMLKSADHVTVIGPASGPGWTGTRYGFTFDENEGQATIHSSGTVSVDSQGRVRQLDETFAFQLQTREKHASITTRTAMTFGSFGTRVDVTAPRASHHVNVMAP
jgi:hypothetical protein